MRNEIILEFIYVFRILEYYNLFIFKGPLSTLIKNCKCRIFRSLFRESKNLIIFVFYVSKWIYWDNTIFKWKLHSWNFYRVWYYLHTKRCNRTFFILLFLSRFNMWNCSNFFYPHLTLWHFYNSIWVCLCFQRVLEFFHPVYFPPLN
jgi:hypothetical protein